MNSQGTSQPSQAGLALDLKDLRRRGEGRAASRRALASSDWASAFAAAYARVGPSLEGPQGLLAAGLPLADDARRAVRAALVASAQCDADSMTRSLEDALFQRLFEATSRTLALQLGVAAAKGLLAGADPRARFDFFCECLNDRRSAAGLLAQYPVLVRRLSLLTAQWRDGALETIRRLEAGLAAVRDDFFSGEDPGVCVAAEPMGDSHAGGRRVQRLTFETGAQAIYKPRPLVLECGFRDVVAWANTAGLTPDLAAAPAIDRGDHGWMYYVQAGACADAGGVERYFRRQGGNLALAYVLGAVDLHYENVIAAGERPVIVDLETLFHTPLAARGPARAGHAAALILAGSVIQTLLLPVYHEGDADPDGESQGGDPSALGYVPGAESAFVAETWVGQDTDDMRLGRARVEVPAAACLPELDGRVVPAAEHVDAILGGFSDAYDFFQVRKDTLLLRRWPMTAFHGGKARRVLRATASYAQLLERSWHPSLGGDITTLESTLDAELRAMRGDDEVTDTERATEVADLVAGDIPYFSFAVGGAGWRASRRRLRALDAADKARQLWIAEMTFVTLGQPLPPRPVAGRRGRAADVGAIAVEARRIGERLSNLAIQTDGRASWLFPSLAGELRLEPVAAGFDLYEGLAGVGLFLGGLGLALHEPRFGRLAEAAMAEAWTVWRGMARETISIGGYSGAGGLAWTFAALAETTGRRDWADKARRIVRAHAVDAAQESAIDVISGRAGFLVAGLGVAQMLGDAPLVDALRPCAMSLAALNTSALPKQSDAGLAHGRAGVGFALARMAAIDGDAERRRRALGLIEEDLATSAAVRDGTTPLSDDLDGRAMAAWCRGGIGAALAALSLGVPPTQETEALVALATHDAADVALCPCHGSLGVLEFLDTAISARVSGAKAAREQVRRVTLERVLSGEHCCDHHHRIEAPGLMTGLAGTGWWLLRELEPGRFPSALTLDPI